MASESIGSPLRSRNAAVEVVVDNNKPERGGAAPHRSSSSKLGLSSADLCDRSSKSDGKRLLIHTDSGYISPTVAPASNGNSPQTPSKELPQIVKFQTGTAASEEKDTEKLNHKTETSMQSVLSARSAPSRESQVDYRRRSLPAESPMEGHHFIQDDFLLLAYECRQSNMGGWTGCRHPYCVYIRIMSQHYNSHRNSHNHTCEKCSNFVDMMNKHMSSCTKTHCPIQLCRNSRQQYHPMAMQFHFSNSSTQLVEKDSPQSSSHSMRSRPHVLGRSSSSADIEESTSYSSVLSSIGAAPVISGLARASLRAKAEEIVNRLDREEPLFSESSASASSGLLTQQIPHSLPTNFGPMSLPTDSAPFQPQVGQGQIMLSPIAEQPGTEDASPSSNVPQLLHHGSNPQFPSFGSGFSSYEMDGPGHTSMDRATVPPQSLKLEPNEQHNFPKQQVLHQLKPDYLTAGDDGFYYKIRDYNLNEVDLLGEGGFGSCRIAQDRSTERMFAIKQNKNERFDSIKDECFVLSRLPEHNNIIQFLGAVLDEKELEFQPPLVCKMMMELAENGNLADMLKDEDGMELPLMEDQSLYYLQQILDGVYFLHQSGFLHLDIKAQNVLVFDGGRTVKLTDFGTAVAVGEATAALKGWTPYFVAPEVVKEEVPKFSADIWSVLCILVEMLTAKSPGCFHFMRPHMAMMFLVGSYKEDQINELVPLDSLDVEEEVKQLFRDVFKAEPSSRPTAWDLLQRPVISSAVKYARYFDECYESEEELDSVPPTTGDFSLIDNGAHEISHVSSSSHHSSIGDVVADLPKFVENQARDRGASQDSGVMGMGDLESSANAAMFGAQLSMRSMSSGSGGPARLVHQDSGLEDMAECPHPDRPVYIPVYHFDMCSTNYRPRSSSLKSNGYPNLTFSSLPPVPSIPPDYTMVQRSFSFSGRPVKRSESCSKSQNSRVNSGLNHVAKRQRPNSIHPTLHLTHSKSAPAIGLDPWRKRRHSLQHIDSYGTGEPWEGDTETDGVNSRGKAKAHLRRTSSEVYVDQGPDIDTPEKEKNRLQDLLSNLSLGPAHSPRHSTHNPVIRQTSDAGVQCDVQSATSSLSSNSTMSNELSDSKKQSDDSGDHDDEHPPSNGSQTFHQIC